MKKYSSCSWLTSLYSYKTLYNPNSILVTTDESMLHILILKIFPEEQASSTSPSPSYPHFPTLLTLPKQHLYSHISILNITAILIPHIQKEALRNL